MKKVLIVPGWLLTKFAYDDLIDSLNKNGYIVDTFKCPGMYDRKSNVRVKDVLSSLRKIIKENNYDMIIAHGYSVNWLLQTKSLLKGKKIILASPCYNDNLKLRFRVLKYFSIIPLLCRRLHLDFKFIWKAYDYIYDMHMLYQLYGLTDGYNYCNIKSAYRILVETLNLKYDKNKRIKADLIVLQGIEDTLIKHKKDNISKLFNCSREVRIHCRHNTFEYLTQEIINLL